MMVVVVVLSLGHIGHSLSVHGENLVPMFTFCLVASPQMHLQGVHLLEHFSTKTYVVLPVTGIGTMLVLAKVFLRLSRFNYDRIEVPYTPEVVVVLARIIIKE